MIEAITLWAICAAVAYVIANGRDKSKATGAAIAGMALVPIGIIYAMTIKPKSE